MPTRWRGRILVWRVKPMSNDESGNRDPRRSDRSTTPKILNLGTLAVLTASALLTPESAMAAGPIGPGAPSAPAAPRTSPAPPPVMAPQVPAITPNTFPLQGTIPTGQMAPSAATPAEPKGTDQAVTIRGEHFGSTTAPSAPKGAGGTVITLNGDSRAITAPSTPNPPQKPSPTGSGR